MKPEKKPCENISSGIHMGRSALRDSLQVDKVLPLPIRHWRSFALLGLGWLAHEEKLDSKGIDWRLPGVIFDKAAGFRPLPPLSWQLK